MRCQECQLELVAYHFGTVLPGVRLEVEEHLLGCPSCLRSFLALKREIETAETDARPSAAARERLRRAVTQELAGPSPVRKWFWWERPLAFGFAGAVVMAAMFALKVMASADGSAPRSLVVDAAAQGMPARVR